jgi:hypothetical protein
MKSLTKQAHNELKEILKKNFCNTSVSYPEELIDDLGITLLNLTTITLKRKSRINKENDFRYYRFICYNSNNKIKKITPYFYHKI